MRNTLILIAAFTLFAGALFFFQTRGTTTLQAGSVPEHVIDAFHAWTVKYHKHFAHPAVEQYRLSVFFANYKMIQEHANAEYTLGMNQFMDLTKSEFKSIYLGFNSEQPNHASNVHTDTNSSGSVDWRTKGDVSPIKDQGQCGSCWAFSTTGQMESIDREFNTHSGSYSEQQLVDCSASYGNNGCNGGLMDNAFKYIMAKGITTESNYPYKAVDGSSCKVDGGDFMISKYTDVAAGNYKALQSACDQQPISIAVDAQEWQFYNGGVFSNCGTSLDHGVLLAGYSADSWIVKNSWGASWGESGYIRLAGNANTCGLANAASYATV